VLILKTCVKETKFFNVLQTLGAKGWAQSIVAEMSAAVTVHCA